MDYRLPSFRQPTPYDVPKTLDDVFNAYMQGKARDEASQLQGFALRDKYGVDPRSMTPAQLDRGFAGPTVVPGAPEFLARTPEDAQAHVEFDPDPHTAAIQRYMMNKRAGEAAQLSDIQAQARMRNSSADWMEKRGPSAPGGGIQLNPTQSSALQWGIHNGFIAPEELTSRGPKTQILADGLAGRQDFKAWYQQAQASGNLGLDDFNPAAQDVSFGAKRSGAQATEKIKGGKGFEIASTVGALDDTLRQAEPFIAKLSPSSIQILNRAYQAGEQQVNDADANRVLGLLNSARGLYSQVIAGGGAGTVESDKRANETIARGLNPEGFRGMKQAVLAEGYSRAGRMTGQIPNTVSAPEGYVPEHQAPSLYSDPRAAQIKADYQAGRITKAEASRRLDALGGK